MAVNIKFIQHNLDQIQKLIDEIPVITRELDELNANTHSRGDDNNKANIAKASELVERVDNMREEINVLGAEIDAIIVPHLSKLYKSAGVAKKQIVMQKKVLVNAKRRTNASKVKMDALEDKYRMHIRNIVPLNNLYRKYSRATTHVSMLFTIRYIETREDTEVAFDFVSSQEDALAMCEMKCAEIWSRIITVYRELLEDHHGNPAMRLCRMWHGVDKTAEIVAVGRDPVEYYRIVLKNCTK